MVVNNQASCVFISKKKKGGGGLCSQVIMDNSNTASFSYLLHLLIETRSLPIVRVQQPIALIPNLLSSNTT